MRISSVSLRRERSTHVRQSDKHHVQPSVWSGSCPISPAAPSPSSSPTSRAAPRSGSGTGGHAAAVDRHLTLLDAAIAAHDGIHFKTIGDAIQAAFPGAAAAVARSLTPARCWPSLGCESDPCGCGWRCMPGKPRRMRDGDYLARASLNRLSRAAGHRPRRSDPAHAGGPAADPWRPPGGATCATWANTDCATCWSRSTSISSCTRTCRPTSRRSRSLEPGHTTCRPADSASLAGRRDARSRASDVRMTSRLVTLTGPGGTGKTRLDKACGRGPRCFPTASIRPLAPLK